MRLLLDTHSLLWFYLGDSQLSRPAQDSIIDPNNIKLISPASYWEIAITLSIQKYTLQVSYDEFIQEAVFDNGFEILPIEPRHTAALISLTFLIKTPSIAYWSPRRPSRASRSCAWTRSSTRTPSPGSGR